MPPEDVLQNVSHETLEKLKVYQALLIKWQKAINLVSPKTISEAWERHFLDSVQVAQFISPSSKVIADIGSGAGFPGLVLAIMRPELEVHMIESDQRKCQFMRTVSRETETPVNIHAERVENMSDDFTPDCVTARALADLEKLLDFCAPWSLRNQALECVFLKGARSAEETEAAAKNFDFECQSHQSVTDPQAAILHLKNIETRAQ